MLIPYLLTFHWMKPLIFPLIVCIKDDENTPKIPMNLFRNLLNVPTKESFFTFNNRFYTQIDGVAMGSPLDTALANIFMSNFENK